MTEQLRNLVAVVKSELDGGFKVSRCMLSTSIVKDFAERMGYTVMRWQGSVSWYSAKYVEMQRNGQMATLEGLTPSQVQKRAEAWARRGVRYVNCRANEITHPDDLGGHLCLVVQKDDKTYFVDPTSFQFYREAKPGLRDSVIWAPKFIVDEIDHTDTPEINFLKVAGPCAGAYKYEPVERFQELLQMPDGAIAKTDLNPKRYPEVYAAIERAVFGDH